MPKYEIMLIVDPSTDGKVVEKIAKDTFKGSVKFEVMERTELAYEINKSKTGKYLMINVETEGENIKEFTRKVNIEKSVWRYLVVNKAEEEKLLKATKAPRVRKPREFNKKSYNKKPVKKETAKPKDE